MLDAMSVMRNFALVLSMVLVAGGCTHAPHAKNNLDAALQVWRSPAATLQQRAEAVNKIVPVGASEDDVVRLLGARGLWARYHGPSVDAEHPHRQLPPYDHTQYEYAFPGGGVELEFDTSNSNVPSWHFVRAYAFLRYEIPTVTTPR